MRPRRSVKMSSKSSVKKRKVIKYVVVLALAIIIRILFALFTPIEVQKYAGLIIIIVAISGFFMWDYVDEKRRKK